MRYEGYTTQERQNDILDKITRYGVESLTPLEKEFLDAYSQNKETETHDKIKYLENEKIFEDDSGYFRFEYQETEDNGSEVTHKGTLYVPKLEWENGKEIEGRIEGRIIKYENGTTSLEFEKDGYDVLEFCNGLEYELDNFIDYICNELEEKKY